MKRVLCIQLGHWPLQRIAIERPELSQKPLVLYETCRGSRRVAVCSARARALGITVGMTSAEASALAGPAPLCLEAYDPSADRAALEELAVWCGRFSPLVGLEDSTAPDSLLLDVTGLDRLFGSESSLAARIVRDFAQRGLVARTAVADTVGAAWAVAHFGQGADQDQQTGRENREAACGFAPWAQQGQSCHQPPNVAIIPPGGASAALRPLPVEALRLPGEVIDLLHQLGIYGIGQLEPLPRADLTSRFGPRLLERWDQATGRLAEPIPAHPLPPELEVERSLEYPATRRETIELVLEQLISRLARMLVRCGRGAVRLECRLDCQPARDVDFWVGLYQPTAVGRHLFDLVRMQLERVRVAAPVSAIRLRAAATAPFEGRQQEWFADGRSPRRPRQLARLVDRLASRLGRHAVLRPRLVRDAQPELAYQYDLLVDGGTGVSPVQRRSGKAGAVRDSTGKMPVAPWRAAGSLRSGGPLRGTPATLSLCGTLAPKRSEADLPPRPLRLLGRPVPLAAVSIMPDGPPVGFHWQGNEHRVVHTWGPERIETGWWRGRPVYRDYYRVETTTGRRYWLFRSLGDRRWFLHGTFE